MKITFQNDSARTKRGKAYKARSDGEYKYFEAHDGELYRPGDHVFIEVAPCEPFQIGTILNFKMVSTFNQFVMLVLRYV